MIRHPHFPGLLLHTDDQLETVLGARLVERRTVHEWPLSCVQKLTLADGTSFAYKAQLPPTVEPEFYQRATSPLLGGHRLLEPVGRCVFLVIDWIDALSLHAVTGGPADLLAQGREVAAGIAAITGDLPHYLDLGSPDSWCAATDSTVQKASALVRGGLFRSIGLSDLRRLSSWATDPVVIDQVTEGARLVNADLRSDQVLVTPAGYRVLDWQRPVIAMPEIDLVSLLVSERLEPRQYLNPTADRVYWMMRLHWAVVAQHDLLGGIGSAFDGWARQAIDRILL
jgi:hypothetical protein